MAHSNAFSYTGWAKQATPGTAVAPRTFMRWKSFAGQETIKSQEVRDGINRDPAFVLKLGQWHTLNHTGFLYADSAYGLLNYALGVTDTLTSAIGASLNTTLTAGTAAGVSTIPVASFTGLVTGQVVQIDTGSLTEYRIIGTPALSLPVTTPTTYAHASGAAVVGLLDPATHTGSSTNALEQLLSFEHSMGNGLEIDRITDAYLEEWKLSAKAGSEAVVDVKATGRIGTAQAAASTVVFEPERPLVFADGTLTFVGPAVASADVMDLVIDIKNTVQNVPVFTSLTPQLLPCQRDIDVEFEVFVPDNTLYRNIFFGSPTGTVLVPNLMQFATLTAKFDNASVPDHFVQLVLNSIQIQDGKPMFDVNGKAFSVRAKGKTTLPIGGGAVATITAQNGYNTAY